MEGRALNADNKMILDAFIENGLHREYTIYCLFPDCDKTVIELQQHPARSIKFNDGFELAAHSSLDKR
ncbi:hypothetical protein [Photobacterium atrarenae]|uniref:Uncharacterized protein n=1 Tax=Photobacterium atrarenae TaxID=865757 RepID=A0ABY5GMH7_9GAMM|nr:hypothetical protein [Photobacterium atrarenae]UTV29980.1 hypothetical protein NNL38_23575 [Photobacterium atrarenae]